MYILCIFPFVNPLFSFVVVGFETTERQAETVSEKSINQNDAKLQKIKIFAQAFSIHEIDVYNTSVPLFVC
jgi:DNA helicase TIP49 (TBP-interacting protein)